MPASLAGAYNGLSFGPATNYHVGAMSGFFDLPEIESRDQPRALASGMFAGTDLARGLTVGLVLVMIADTPAAYDALVDALVAATAARATELPLQVFGLTRYISCRPRKRSIPIDCEGEPQRAGVATLEFFATNPVLVVGTP